MACALASGALFMLVATWAAMPVSTTHAIVGAVLGMTLVGAGASCVKWGYPGLLAIVASWFVSPVFAGALSGIILVAIKRCVLEAIALTCCMHVPHLSHIKLGLAADGH